MKAFYFANGGGNSIASGTAVSAGKYTARVGEEASLQGSNVKRMERRCYRPKPEPH
jgi:hypothetical protein